MNDMQTLPKIAYSALQRLWGEKSRILITVGICLVLILGGIGVFTAMHRSEAKPDGYLFTDETSVDFIQFTADHNGHLAGVYLAVNAHGGIIPLASDGSFTGIQNGSQISLTFLEDGQTMMGTLNNNTFTLQMQANDGQMGTVTLYAASLSEYNNAIALFYRRIDAKATAQAYVQATATAQAVLDQAVLSANDQLSNDVSNLNSEGRSLVGSTDFSDVLNAYSKGWKQMQQDWQQEQNDYQQGCGSYGYNGSVVSYDASVVTYDLDVVRYDDDILAGDTNTVKSAVTTMQKHVQSLSRDWQDLQAARSADTNEPIRMLYTASDITSFQATAQAQVDAANTALQSAQAQARQYDTEAAQMNISAQKLVSSMHCD